jgi:hypothetical protein
MMIVTAYWNANDTPKGSKGLSKKLPPVINLFA